MNKLFLILGAAVLTFSTTGQTNSAGSTTNGAPAPLNLRIETDVPAVTNTPSPEIRISADAGQVGLDTRVVVHRGNVKAIVTDPVMELTCDILTIRVPNEGEKPEHILAERNVVIDHEDKDGRKTRGTGDKALYTYTVTGSLTNETIELSGNARLESRSGSGSGEPIIAEGEPIIWDLINNIVLYTNSSVSIPIKSSGTNAPSRTKTPPGL